MSKAKNILEVVTNVAIILVSIFLCVTLIYKFGFSTNSLQSSPEITKGTQISIRNVEYSKANKTLVMALSSQCHFCSESASFYKKIEQTVSDPSKTQLVAVLPQDSQTSTNYLQNLGIKSVEIRQQPLSEIQVAGTPTLILLDKEGKVLESWVGKLPPEKEKEVLEKIQM